MGSVYTVETRRVIEIDLGRLDAGDDVDVSFVPSCGPSFTVPAFHRSDGGWHVRFSAGAPGQYGARVRMAPDKPAVPAPWVIEVHAPETVPENPLYAHGRIQVHPSHRYFCHEDGTPFFYLADDWWHGTSRRLDWPDGFRELLLDRKTKGFTMINMAAGLACDVSKEQLPGANEAGLPWGREYEYINPDWFDMADLRISAIVEAGLVPGIFFSWGYWMTLLGYEKIRRHVRYCVARWGAYPVAWSLCGELTLPYYLSENTAGDAARQQEQWTEIGRYLRSMDGFKSMVTNHPFGRTGRADLAVLDRSVIDYNMLQGGHGDVRVAQWSLERTLQAVSDPESLKPMVMGETCFEGMYQRTSPYEQRLLFYGQFLNGVVGICYGAEGLWQMNTETEPLGPSPHGQAWSYIPWKRAMHFEGAAHMGIGRRLLERFSWWEMAPHREWVRVPEKMGGATVSFAAAAGIPGRLRVVYLGQPSFRWAPQSAILRLEPGIRYTARYFDPITGTEHDLGAVTPDASGTWMIPYPPIMQDWVLILEA